MKTAILKPMPGCTVRDPVSAAVLPDAGELKTLDSYWRRRLLKKEVVIVDAEKPVKRGSK